MTVIPFPLAAERLIESETIVRAERLAKAVPGSRNLVLFYTAMHLFELCRNLKESRKMPWVKATLLEASTLAPHEALETVHAVENKIWSES